MHMQPMYRINALLSLVLNASTCPTNAGIDEILTCRKKSEEKLAQIKEYAKEAVNLYFKRFGDNITL